MLANQLPRIEELKIPFPPVGEFKVQLPEAKARPEINENQRDVNFRRMTYCDPDNYDRSFFTDVVMPESLNICCKLFNVLGSVPQLESIFGKLTMKVVIDGVIAL